MADATQSFHLRSYARRTRLLYNCSSENYTGVTGVDDEHGISSDIKNLIRNSTEWGPHLGFSILHRFDGQQVDGQQVSHSNLICHVSSFTLGELVWKRSCEGVRARCLEPKFEGLVWCCGVCPE